MKACTGRSLKTTCLYAAIFIYFLSSYMFSPFFSMYVKGLGGSYAAFALALSVTGVILSLLQSYIGYLSDKIGAGRLVLLGGLISVVGMVLMGVLYHRYLVFPLYLLMNIGMGILVPAVFTLISYRKDRNGESLIPGYRSVQGAGVIAGPVIGGWLMGQSYRGNVLVSGLLMLLAVALFAVCLQGEKTGNTVMDSAERHKTNFKEALREILHNRAFLVIMLLFALIELSYDFIRLNLPIAGGELNFHTEVIGTALSAYFVTFTIFQIPINKKLKRLKKRTALLLMGLLSLLPCAALAVVLPDYMTIPIMAGVGLTIGSLFTFCTVLAAEESPADKKGTYMGVFHTVMPCTNIVSPLLTAALAGWHLKAPYIFAVLLIVLFIVLAVFLTRPAKLVYSER